MRECLAPTRQSCLVPCNLWGTKVPEEARGLGGSRFLLWEVGGARGFLPLSCTGSGYIRYFVSALTAT